MTQAYEIIEHSFDVVIVGVDEKTVSGDKDTLPLDRTRDAKVIDALSKAGAAVIASGGVGNLGDLELLSRVAAPNVEGAIVGRALYERRFSVAEGIAALA